MLLHLILEAIKDFIFEYSKNLRSDFERIEEFVWVGKGTTIEKSVLINGPAIIGYNCEIRHFAYIRENVIIGEWSGSILSFAKVTIVGQ